LLAVFVLFLRKTIDFTMKNYLLLTAGLFFCINAPAQTCDTVYIFTDTKAEYINGTEELQSKIKEELLPVVISCREKDQQPVNKLLMLLTIDENGKVKDVTFKNAELSVSCKAELKKKLITMKGWTPSVLDGQKVCSYYHLSVSCLKWE
jgi:hypothetical protein